nr:ChbG/HpnK family deacetylase [Candidatus Neomarinimicrobiota bacterium]
MKNLLLIFIIIAGVFLSNCGKTPEKRGAEILIRCDDIGMCHSVNMAAKQVLETGLPISASVMFVCPWYQEAMDILKNYPNVSIGVHLTLNAEWKNYRWGPVIGAAGAPTLVDSCGYFFPSRKLFFERQPDINEVEKELRAQIDRAINTGLKIDYLDYHMGTAVGTPEFCALVENLATEYQLGISRYFSEMDFESIYSVSYSDKIDSLVARVDRLSSDCVNLLVFHIGKDTPEMQAMKDLNPFGLPEMSKHRQA